MKFASTIFLPQLILQLKKHKVFYISPKFCLEPGSILGSLLTSPSLRWLCNSLARRLLMLPSRKIDRHQLCDEVFACRMLLSRRLPMVLVNSQGSSDTLVHCTIPFLQCIRQFSTTPSFLAQPASKNSHAPQTFKAEPKRLSEIP